MPWNCSHWRFYLYWYQNRDCEITDQSKILDIEEEDVTYDKNEIPNRTFNNPSQVDKSDSDEWFRCDSCDFASAMKDITENHTTKNYFIVGVTQAFQVRRN